MPLPSSFATKKFLQSSTLNDTVTKFNLEVSNLYNRLAPQKVKQITKRPKMPWFTHECLIQKRIVRRREKIWLKYSEQHQWEAYKRERARYRNIINYNKKCFVTKRIRDCNRDHKKLHALVSNLTSSEVVNRLPDSSSDQKLADDFADFFLQKIQRIKGTFC